MCGLFGLVGSLNHKNEISNVVLKLLNHRGPDDCGVLSFERAILGHTRLAIQDVVNGAQPMTSTSEKCVLIFNGEIYNHIELRALLPNFHWKTMSDTETVLELFEAFGPKIIPKFIGMFAFGFWHIQDSILFLGRDFFGEKPIYYNQGLNQLTFCSDPRGVMLLNQSQPQLESSEFSYFLKYGHIESSNSTFPNIFMLKPGQILRWENGEISISQIENFETRTTKKKLNSKNLRNLLENAVERTLIADDKVGVMLSGGLDSSIIAALASKNDSNLLTFTVSLLEKSEDTIYSRKLSKLLKTSHHEILITPKILAETIENLLGDIPQPFADTALIPTYILSKLASNHTKVLLSGDGADEVFAGYGYYEKYRNLDGRKLSKMNSYFKQMRYLVSKNTRSKRINRNREEFRESLLLSKRISIEESWNYDLAIFTDHELMKMSKYPFEPIRKGEICLDHKNNPLESVLNADKNSYLSGNILRKSDIGGMFASVEIRAPYLDKDLNMYLKECEIEPRKLTKRILYDACSDIVPEEIFTRRKQGFGAPLDLWFSYPEVEKLISSLLNNPKSVIYKYFRFEEAKREIAKSNLKKWNFYALAVWLEKNVA